MKNTWVLMLILAGIFVIGCEIKMSPTATTAGRDMTPTMDDVHDNIGPGESCGTANENSGCHGKTVTISMMKEWLESLGFTNVEVIEIIE